MPRGESSHDRFRRLAEARVSRAIHDIRLIGNLSNRNNYEFTAEEVDKIFRTLEGEMKQAKSRFLPAGKRDAEFKL